MVFKVGDTVKITYDPDPKKFLEGKYATIMGIFNTGIINVNYIRDTAEKENVSKGYDVYLSSSVLEPYYSHPEFSINDWDSIMEVIANG